MDSSQYDYIFVGASPLMCLHAAALADRYKVLLLDDRSAIGGVWQSGTFDGKEFPCAVPHMLEPHPGVYDFLEQHLDLEMEDVQNTVMLLLPGSYWVKNYTPIPVTCCTRY